MRDNVPDSSSERTGLLEEKPSFLAQHTRLLILVIAMLLVGVAAALVIIFVFLGEDNPAVGVVLPEQCRYAVVGAGYGGVYWAWRAGVEAGVIDPADICIFEGLDRIGGRTLSSTIPEWGDIVVDLGAYRFDMAHHLVRNMALDNLGLSVRCYTPGTCTDNTGMRVFIQDTENADRGLINGYVSGITAMEDALVAAGARRIMTGFFLRDLILTPDSTGNLGDHANDPASDQMSDDDEDVHSLRLVFHDGQTVDTTLVVLNMGPTSLNALQQSDESLLTGIDALEELKRQTVAGAAGLKQYLYYEDAWWVNYLNLTFGFFQSNEMSPELPGFDGRYHDGDVRCEQEGHCHGVLQSRYMFGSAAVAYFSQFTDPDNLDAVTAVRKGDEHGFLLAQIHDRLMAYHEDALREVGIDPSSLAPPSSMLFSTFGAPALPHLPGVHRSIQGDPQFLLRNNATQYLAGEQIFLVNEAYADQTVWAESSLRTAERVLVKHFGLTRPASVAPAYWRTFITHMLDEECTTVADCSAPGECSSVECVDGVCAVTVHEGEPCRVNDPCVATAVCTSQAACSAQSFVPCSDPLVCLRGDCVQPETPALPKCHYNDGYFNFYWEFVDNDGDGVNEAIRIAMNLPATEGGNHGYVALGIGPSMINADMIVGMPNRRDGSAYFVDDRYSQTFDVPSFDEDLGGSYDLRNTYMEYADAVRTMHFERDLVTGDPWDVDIVPDQLNSLTYAFREDTEGLDYHANNFARFSIVLSQEC